MNEKRLFKVSLAWLNIVYVTCVLGFVLFPGVAAYLTTVAFHSLAADIRPISASNFVAGLIFWNVLFVLGYWLFVKLDRLIKN